MWNSDSILRCFKSERTKHVDTNQNMLKIEKCIVNRCIIVEINTVKMHIYSGTNGFLISKVWLKYVTRFSLKYTVKMIFPLRINYKYHLLKFLLNSDQYN